MNIANEVRQVKIIYIKNLNHKGILKSEVNGVSKEKLTQYLGNR